MTSELQSIIKETIRMSVCACEPNDDGIVTYHSNCRRHEKPKLVRALELIELSDQREAALESKIGALNRANAELTDQLKKRHRMPQEQPFD